jgi:lipoate-protein ligase A
MRLLDLGAVPYLESQTVYHAVAHAMDETTPDTISLMRPNRPYVCIGFHQDLEKEIDLEYCEAQGLPVLRREVGGGAVYLDSGQLFVHFIFHRERLPRQVEEVYKLFIRPLVEMYRAIRVQAEHRPLNDIVVGGRKIGGTGIASIREAMVIAGSVMFDFDTATMARALKVSSEKMRDKLYQSLDEYMTTIRRELGTVPPRDEVKDLLAEKISETLGVELEPGRLSAKERRFVRVLNRRFSSRRWLRRKGGLARPGITIGAGVRVAESEYKAPGGLVHASACLKGEVIEDLSLSGDFTFHPASALERLEASLRGQPLEYDHLLALLTDFYAASDLQAPGLAPEEMARALIALSERSP